MFKDKPITMLIAAGLMILLVALAGIYPLFSTNTPGGFAGGRPGTNMPGGAREIPQDGNFTPDGNPPSGMTPPDGAFQPGSGQMQRGNFNGSVPSANSTMVKVMQLLRGIQLVGAVLISLLGVLSIISILMGKGWARKTAIVTAVLAILLTVTSMFSFMFGFALVIKIITLVLAIAIMVLCLLSKARITANVPA